MSHMGTRFGDRQKRLMYELMHLWEAEMILEALDSDEGFAMLKNYYSVELKYDVLRISKRRNKEITLTIYAPIPPKGISDDKLQSIEASDEENLKAIREFIANKTKIL